MATLPDAVNVLGTQGPPGANISSAQWAALQAALATDTTGNLSVSGTGQVTGAFTALSTVKVQNAATLRSGTGTPEGNVSGSIGDLYLRTDAVVGNGLNLWRKEGGAASTRGWVPVDGVARFGVESEAFANPSAATIGVSGMSAWSLNAGTVTNNDHTSGPSVDFATSAVLNNDAGPNGPAEFRADWSTDATFKIVTGPDITSVCYWVGLSDTDPTGVVSPNGNLAAFRFNVAGAGDTTWQARTADGVAGGTTDTGQAVSSATQYRLRIVLSTTFARFYVNEVFYVERTTNLPTSSTYLRPYVRIRTQVAGVRHLEFATFHGWHT